MHKADLNKFNLPDSPGVYFFKKGKDILYIGKATSLKDRVRSYFSNDVISTRGSLIVDMVTQADNIDFNKTDSVLEALILEAELIKKFQPICNTKEKDNKSYNFVVITKDEFPRVIIERGRTISFQDKKYNSVFGPFPSQAQLTEALKIIRKIFPFITKEGDSKIYQQIGLEPDISSIDAKKQYANTIRNIKLFFQGKKGALIKKLEQEMKFLAKHKEFELAGKRRNQIFALNHIKDISLIKSSANYGLQADFRIESYDIAHMRGSHSVGVMTVMEDGEIKKSSYRKFILRDTKKGDDVGGLKEIITRRFKHDEWKAPNLIVVDGGKNQINQARKIIADLDLKIPIVSVVKDEKHKPKNILGSSKTFGKYEKDILLVNNEAHRFAIEFYRQKHRKSLY